MWSKVSMYLNSIINEAQETGKVLALAFLRHSYGKTGAFMRAFM